MALTTYSPKDVIISLAGIHTVAGLADGVFVKITKETKPFDKARSMDGEISRIYNPDDTHKIEISLQQSSGSNDVLTLLYNVDVATGMGKFPLMITDSKGNTSFYALTAWVEDVPEVTFSNTMEVRVWTITATQVAYTIGGNEAQSDIEQALLLGTSVIPALKQYF